MGTEEGLKALGEACEELERRGCFVDKTVRIYDEAECHPRFWGQTGKVYFDDPEEDLVEVKLKDCTVSFHRHNFEVIE